MTTKEWNKMTQRERQQSRFDRWLAPDNIEFTSTQVHQAYTARVQRVIDAIKLEKTPDRVPVLSPAGFLPCFLYGVSCKDVMYDIDLACKTWERFAREYPTDLIKPPSYCGMGRAMEILDYRLYKWPGNELPDNVSFQAVESEWMKADEYELLMEDPSDFWLRTYLPRIFGSMEPFKDLAALNRIVEIPNVGSLASFGAPGVREALNKLADAGEELLEIRKTLGLFRNKVISELGFATSVGGGAKAPFDVLADTMRAFRGMIMDMFRNPDAIAKAIETITPLQIRAAVADVNITGNPMVFMPLHKGADGWMSEEHFENLYWPSLKKVILGLVEEGCVPYVFAEGSFTSRLKYLRELPKGTTMWMFDQIDMAEVKRQVGDTVCIMGNLPTSLMVTGNAAQVDDYCKKLIDTCGPGGGYILATGAALDEGNAETTRAMIDAVEKYGSY
jgi:hypothetical protein